MQHTTIKLLTSIVYIFFLVSCGENSINSKEIENSQEMVKVDSIMNHWVEILAVRLSLTEESKNELIEIYSAEYTQIGGNAQDVVSKEDAIRTRNKILISTKDEVLAHLTDDQKIYYIKFCDDQSETN